MADFTGTYSIAQLRAARFASAATFGLDTINDVLQLDLSRYNAFVQDELNLLADPTDKQSRIYGTSATHHMIEVDPYGAAPSLRQLPGVTVQFPLRLFKATIGWTSKALEIATPSEIVEKVIQVRTGHSRAISRMVQASLFNDTNYTWVDNLTNGVTLTIRRLLNADGQAIPNGPAGEVFVPGTHDHYNATATGTLTNADVDALVEDVTEHGNTKGVKVMIHLDNKVAFVALTGFLALGDGGIVYSGTNNTVKKMNFDDLNNQLIGYWRNSSIEVWVKPIVPEGYAMCVATDIPEKVLAYRQREQDSLKGLRIAASNNEYPLIADYMEAEFGFGVWNRTAAAILITDSNSWSNPTLTTVI